MQMVKWMILLTFFIAGHGQTIHISITTSIGCKSNVGGQRCTLFDTTGNSDSSCLMKDCVAGKNPFYNYKIEQCNYVADPRNCVPMIFEFEIPESKQKHSGKCPESKIALQLEERVIQFRSDKTFRFLPHQVEIYSDKTNSVSKISWDSNRQIGNLCPIAPSANGLPDGAPYECFLEGESYFDYYHKQPYTHIGVESVELKFLDEKTKSVIQMPAKQCASSTPSTTAPSQKSRDKLLELLLIQMMVQNNGFVSRGAYPRVYNSIPGLPYSIAGQPSTFSGIPHSGLPYSIAGQSSTFSGIPPSGLPSITGVRRAP